MHPLYEKANVVCLARELELRGHTTEMEVVVPIRYKGYEFQEKLRIDVLVDGCLVVETKALDEDKVNMPRHKAQCLSYMKLMNLPLGLVVNFGDSRLGRSGIARVILKGAKATCVPLIPGNYFLTRPKELAGRLFGQAFNVSTGSCAEALLERMGGEGA